MSATPLDTDTHARELAAVKGQLAALTVRCEHLEARLQSQAEVDRSVVEEAQRLRQRLSDTETEVVSLRSDVAAARAHINGLSAQLQTVQETSKLFTQEIEVRVSAVLICTQLLTAWLGSGVGQTAVFSMAGQLLSNGPVLLTLCV